MAGSSRWASQAAQDAMLRFAPTRTSLAEALRTARETYGQTVHAGRATATLTRRAAQQALPQIQQAYGKANAAEQTGTTLVNSALASLTGPTADLFKGAQASEVNTQLANLLKAKASDEGLIAKQQVAAQEGAQFNQQAARATLQKTLAGLLSKSQATAQEEGLFGASEADKLAHEAETLEQRERASERTANTSRANAEEGAQTSRGAYSYTHGGRGSGSGGGPNLLSPDKLNAAASTLREIEHEARALRQEGVPRGNIYSELTSEGGGKNVVKRDAQGREIKNSKGEKEYEKTPVIKAHDVLLTEAALDSVFGYGHVSRGVLEKLHAAGYSIKALGLAPPPKGKPKAAPPKPKKNQGVSGEVQA